MKKLFWGFFFVYLNFNLNLNAHSINILPNFVGWWLVLQGMEELKHESRYFENPRLIICCGAKGANEPAPEGECMRNWLIEQGVPADMVLAETRSMNTHQNLEYAIGMLPADAEKITIITSDYHFPRAMAIARDMGLDANGVGSPCKPEYWIKNHFREVLAWGKYFLKKVVPIE